MKTLKTQVKVTYNSSGNIKTITTPHDKNETLQNPIYAVEWYKERETQSLFYNDLKQFYTNYPI